MRDKKGQRGERKKKKKKEKKKKRSNPFLFGLRFIQLTLLCELLRLVCCRCRLGLSPASGLGLRARSRGGVLFCLLVLLRSFC